MHIAEHDYNVKLNATKKFLESGFKVKVALRLRGRQNMLKKEALAFMQGFYDNLNPETAKLETPPKIEGSNITMIISNV